MLEFRGVSLTFPNGTRALRGIDLVVPRGQFCAMLGHSGAGKSSLLNLVHGAIFPTEGAVRFDDREVRGRSVRAVQRRIGAIHQRFHLVGRLPTLTNVLTGFVARMSTARAMAGYFTKQERRKAAALLERVGVPQRSWTQRAETLSGGEQQRVAVARAFVRDPDVILADEPVASLDPKVAAEVLRMTRDISRERGVTVLCSLHQPELAERFGDRVVGLNAGQMVFDAEVSQMNSRHLDQVYERKPEANPPRQTETAP